jgi:hypothetical protein
MANGKQESERNRERERERETPSYYMSIATLYDRQQALEVFE